MVSEQRGSTYATAVSGTGESSQRSHPSTPIVQSPGRTNNPQRNSAPQRGNNSDDIKDPLPDIHKVYVMAEKFERQLNVANLSDLEIGHANAIQTVQTTNENFAAAINHFNGRKNVNIDQISHEQIQKLISLFQNQAGQTQASTTAAVSLLPTFNKESSQNEVYASGETWEDDWFC